MGKFILGPGTLEDFDEVGYFYLQGRNISTGNISAIFSTKEESLGKFNELVETYTCKLGLIRLHKNIWIVGPKVNSTEISVEYSEFVCCMRKKYYCIVVHLNGIKSYVCHYRKMEEAKKYLEMFNQKVLYQSEINQ